MNITFGQKIAYRFNPSDKKDARTAQEMVNTSYSHTIVQSAKPTEQFLMINSTSDDFVTFSSKQAPKYTQFQHFTDFWHDCGVPIDDISSSELYEKLNFGPIKKLTTKLGRYIRQNF